MPGMYQKGDYDLAGFSVGEVMKKDLINGERLKDGDTLMAIASSGFHSNGYSLVRKILEVKKTNLDLKKACLTPSKIYVRSIMTLLQKHREKIKGIANITGSGFLNIPRMNENYTYQIYTTAELPVHMKEVCEMSGLDERELHRTFNMGVGMVIATDDPETIGRELELCGEKTFVIGRVEMGVENSEKGKIFLKGKEL